MLKTLAGIIGIILLIPIALVIVAMIVITLIGGYIALISDILLTVGAIVLAVILLVALYKHFFG